MSAEFVYIIRHGQSELNPGNTLICAKPESDLTDIGRQQSAQAADWLMDKNIQFVVSSHYHRARQTATIIGKFLRITPEIDYDLHEIDCGDLHGRSDDDAWELWRNLYARWQQLDWEATYPGGESFREGYHRYLAALQHASTQKGNAVVVTHGGITRAVLPYLCVNAAALQYIDELSNAAIVVLEPYDDTRFICRAWGVTEHLTS